MSNRHRLFFTRAIDRKKTIRHFCCLSSTWRPQMRTWCQTGSPLRSWGFKSTIKTERRRETSVLRRSSEYLNLRWSNNSNSPWKWKLKNQYLKFKSRLNPLLLLKRNLSKFLKNKNQWIKLPVQAINQSKGLLRKKLKWWSRSNRFWKSVNNASFMRESPALNAALDPLKAHDTSALSAKISICVNSVRPKQMNTH